MTEFKKIKAIRIVLLSIVHAFVFIPNCITMTAPPHKKAPLQKTLI